MVMCIKIYYTHILIRFLYIGYRIPIARLFHLRAKHVPHMLFHLRVKHVPHTHFMCHAALFILQQIVEKGMHNKRSIRWYPILRLLSLIYECEC